MKKAFSQGCCEKAFLINNILIMGKFRVAYRQYQFCE
jgi:hypothetical protein